MLKRVLTLLGDLKTELVKCRGYHQLIQMLRTTKEFKDIIVRFFKEQFVRTDLH